MSRDKQPWNQAQSLALKARGNCVSGSASNISSVRMVRFTHRLSQPSLGHWSSAVPTAEHRLPSTHSLSGERQRTLSRGPWPFNCSMLNEAMWPEPYCSHGNVLLDIFFFFSPPNCFSFNCSGHQQMPLARWWQLGVILNFYRGLSGPSSCGPGQLLHVQAGQEVMAPSWTIHSLHKLTARSFHAGFRCVTAVTHSHPSGERWPFIVFFETLVCYNLCLD